MPQGMGRRFRKMIAGLLVLSVFVLSVVQAQAAVLPGTQGASGASAAVHPAGTADAMAPLPGQYHTGSPCKSHDGTQAMACCFIGGCSAMSGWISVAATVLPAIMPTTLVYPGSPSVRLDGLLFAPAPPPPRRIV